MRRRDFITVIGSVAAWPHVVHAQQSAQKRLIGVLMVDAENDPEGRAHAKAFRDALRELGWTAERNVQIEYRWAAGDAGRIRGFAKELVAMRPDVILARSTPATAALKAETRTVPIIFTTVSDPIGGGFVESFSRPDSNITGFTNFESSIGGKWLGLLKEISPHVARVAVLFNPEMAPYAPYYVHPLEAAARLFAVEPISGTVHDDAAIERTIATLAHDSNGGLIVLPDGFTTSDHRKIIIEQANRNHVPAIYPYRFFVEEGGLVSYGIDINDLYRRAASYIDRILRGAKPSDLPIQQPSKFELVINLKTAKALELEVPLSLQIRADALIE